MLVGYCEIACYYHSNKPFLLKPNTRAGGSKQMTQIKSLMVLFFAVLLLNGCANFHDNPVLPSHMISNGSNTDPIVFFVHGAGDGNEHNAIPGINTTFIQFQYDYLDGTDTNSEELLKAFIEFREGHPNNTIIIVAHSYGCCVVVAAIQKDDGDNFKNTTIVLLSPVIFGVEGALNKSEPTLVASYIRSRRSA